MNDSSSTNQTSTLIVGHEAIVSSRPGYQSAASDAKAGDLKLPHSDSPCITSQLEEFDRLLALDDDGLLAALREQQRTSFLAQHYNDRDRRICPIAPGEILQFIDDAASNWEVFHTTHGLADPEQRHRYCLRLRQSLTTEKRALTAWSGKPADYLLPADYVVAANRGEVACRIIEAAHTLGKKVIILHDGNDMSYEGLLAEGDFMYYIPCFKDANRKGTMRFDVIGMYALGYFLQKEKINLHTVAIHPGWGFNAEDPEWVAEIERLGFRMVGPYSQIIRYLGAKTNAVMAAKTAGLGTPASSGKIVGTRNLPPDADREAEWLKVETLVRDFLKRAGEQGIALLLLKDAMGGGGSGQRLLTKPNEAELLEAVKQYWEKYAEFSVDQFLPATRHMEFQVLVDIAGNVRFGMTRDCTLQRARQKYNEETAELSPQTRIEMQTKIREFLELVHKKLGKPYTGAATFEFLYDPMANNFYFMEVNTRLQVENCVSACVDSIDYFRTQLDLADGKLLLDQAELDKRRKNENRYAIQARICLERILSEEERVTYSKVLKCDVESVPVGGPGVYLTRFVPHLHDGIYLFADDRIPRQIAVNGVVAVPSGYDSMIAKMVAIGKTALEARMRLHDAIMELEIEGPGIQSNRELILVSLDHAHRGDLLKLAHRKVAADALTIIRGKQELGKLAAQNSSTTQELTQIKLLEDKLTPEQWGKLAQILEGFGVTEFYTDRFQKSNLTPGALNPILRAFQTVGIKLGQVTYETLIHPRALPIFVAHLRHLTGLEPHEAMVVNESFQNDRQSA